MPATCLALALFCAAMLAASAEPNSGSSEITRADTAYKVGEVYKYRYMDLFSKMESGQYSLQVTEVNASQVRFRRGSGAYITDLLGNEIRRGKAWLFTNQQIYPADYSIGKKWSTRFGQTGSDGRIFDVDYDFEIVARERITVPAGSFDAYRIEGSGYMRQKGGLRSFATDYKAIYTIWMAPEKNRRFIALDYTLQCAVLGCGYITTNRHELVSFLPAPESVVEERQPESTVAPR